MNSNQIYKAISDIVAYNFAYPYLKNNLDKLISLLASFTHSDRNSLTGLSPDDGQNISFLFELCDPNKKEEDVDDTLLKIMYTQMAGYGNEWSIPKKKGITHHLVHLSQSLD